MTAEFDAAFNFTDVQGLAGLKREAAANTPEARRAVARQFESLFLSMMLGRMRDASSVIDGGLVDRERMRFHEDLHDRQLALALSQGPGIGLADSILRQLGDAPAARPTSSRAPLGAGPEALGRLAPDARATFPARRSEQIEAAAAPPTRAANAVPFESPAEFVAALRPHARRAAAALGVPADVLVAQAALETGWGRHMIRDGAGGPSFNLFGIKAYGGWSGPSARVPTLEFVDGVPERRAEPFRVYGSIAESFADYVRVVRGRPRYEAAVGAGSAEDYARALQAGGYSTDPRYAEKIVAIAESIAAERAAGAEAQVSGARADTALDGAGRTAGGDET